GFSTTYDQQTFIKALSALDIEKAIDAYTNVKNKLDQAFVWEPGTQVVKDIRNALCDIKHEVEVFLLVDQLDRLAQVFY
ncbi:hypothetical protein MXE01_15685, partial [Legionella pneumophila]|nr:hypothetical protein [Legionella pneumophila]